MKIEKFFAFTMILLMVYACSNSPEQKTEVLSTIICPVTASKTSTDTMLHKKPLIFNNKPGVLVLPSYDLIANEGISPQLQKYLENTLSKDSSIRLTKFSYKEMSGTQYANVFDKKYCGLIVQKLKTDIIVMSKLEQTKRTGNMNNDCWNFRIRYYHTNSGTQTDSQIKGDGLTAEMVAQKIASSGKKIIDELTNRK